MIQKTEVISNFFSSFNTKIQWQTDRQTDRQHWSVITLHAALYAETIKYT